MWIFVEGTLPVRAKAEGTFGKKAGFTLEEGRRYGFKRKVKTGWKLRREGEWEI